MKLSVFDIGGIFWDQRKIGCQWVSGLDLIITKQISLLYPLFFRKKISKSRMVTPKVEWKAEWEAEK
jgi:hypothetical protein